MSKYSVCKTCQEKEIRGMEVFCTRFNKRLIIGQLNSWESDFFQLPECIKKERKGKKGVKMKKKEYEIGDTLCKVTKAETKTLIETADEREAVQKLIEDMIGQLIKKERECVTVGKEWWERVGKKYKLPKLNKTKSLIFDKETREIYVGKRRMR